MNCYRCQASLDAIDVGAFRKLINRNANEYMCRNCLATDLEWSREHLDAVVLMYRKRGCLFFPPLETEKENIK